MLITASHVIVVGCVKVVGEVQIPGLYRLQEEWWLRKGLVVLCHFNVTYSTHSILYCFLPC